MVGIVSSSMIGLDLSHTHIHNKSTQFAFSQRVSFYFLCGGGGSTEHQNQNMREVKHLLDIPLQSYRGSSLHVQLRIGATVSLRIVQVLWGGSTADSGSSSNCFILNVMIES